MPDQQTWKIIVSPRDRWQLTVLLMHTDLKFKGKRRTDLFRFRNALGLMEPTEAYLGEKKGYFKQGLDGQTKNVFTVTVNNAEFLTGVLNELDLHNSQLARLERVIVQLEEAKATGDVDAFPEYDPSKEDWVPVPAPLLEEPDRYVEINAMLLRNCEGDFKKYIELYLKEAEQPVAKAA